MDKPIITARVIADSISEVGARLITLHVRYPRIVHAEFMTHRSASKNSSSSRAIPTKRMLKQVRSQPASPVEWGSNRSGMQAGAELTGWRLWVTQTAWSMSAKSAAFFSWVMMKAGAHKQIANRVTEPYQYMNVVVSDTDWSNFEELRCHKDADPTIRDLAIEVMTAIDCSTPKLLTQGQWHLPFVTSEDVANYTLTDLIKICVARCARVSYLTFEGKTPSAEDDMKLYDKLVAARPRHMSPTEHQATPFAFATTRSGNFKGWMQYRKMIENSSALYEEERPAPLRRVKTADEQALYQASQEWLHQFKMNPIPVEEYQMNRPEFSMSDDQMNNLGLGHEMDLRDYPVDKLESLAKKVLDNGIESILTTDGLSQPVPEAKSGPWDASWASTGTNAPDSDIERRVRLIRGLDFKGEDQDGH